MLAQNMCAKTVPSLYAMNLTNFRMSVKGKVIWKKLVNLFLFGKKYELPENLTIMTAMEYAGYQLVRGCGCRNGFCGACATIYRIKGDKELKACLACQTNV